MKAKEGARQMKSWRKVEKNQSISFGDKSRDLSFGGGRFDVKSQG
jgi:hypothetical protein